LKEWGAVKKSFYKGHTQEGAAMTQLILASFRLHGFLLADGDRLTHRFGLTSARWQVLSAVARSTEPKPVAWVARDMGLARQSVQRVVNDLESAGLLSFQPNPRHKRATLLVITNKGHQAFKAVTELQVPWVNSLAEGTKVREIETALHILQGLCLQLQKNAPSAE